MDSLTVLCCTDPGARAGKHIGADGTSAKIETKTNFTFRTLPVRDFDSFVGALAEVERNPLEYLIRGEPTSLAWKAKAAGRTVRRLTATDPVYFASAPRGRHWWLADSDDMLPPEGVGPTSPEAIGHVVAHLGDEFRDVTFWWQLTSSAGTARAGGKIKLRLGFWLGEPVTDEAAAEHACALNEAVGFEVLDPAIYRTGQPNLVARPTFAAGVADPITVRSGVVRKAHDTVKLVPRRRAGYVPGGGGGGLQEIEYDDNGKARDGREAVLTRIWLDEVANGPEDDTFEGCADRVCARAEEELYLGRNADGNAWPRQRIIEKGRRDWQNREALRKRFGKPNSRKPVEGVEPYWKSDPLEADEVAAEIEAEVDAWLAEPHDLMLRVTASAGKTRAACRRTARNLRPGGEAIDVFVPTHELAGEVVEHFRQANPALAVVEVEGRNERNCKRYPLTEKVGKAGASVQKTCCDGGTREEGDGDVVRGQATRCPHFDDCPFQKQRLLKADVYVQQHAHLTQPRPKGWTEAKRAIVDEACFRGRVRVSKLAYADIVQEDPKRSRSKNRRLVLDEEWAREGFRALAYESGKADLAACVEEIGELEAALASGDAAALEAKRLEAWATRDLWRDLGRCPRTWGEEELESLRLEKRVIKGRRRLKGRLLTRGVTALTDAATLAEAVRIAMNELPAVDRVGRAIRDAVDARRTDIPKAVAEAGVTPEMVEADAQAEHARWKGANILKVHPAMADAKILAAVEGWKGIPGRYYALRELAKAMRSGREADDLALAVVGPNKEVRVRWSPDRWRVRSLPTLFLDGSGNQLIAEAVKPGTRFRKIDARQNVHVTQVVDRTLSKYSLLEAEDAERTRATVQAAIAAFAAGSRTGLLVTYKDLVELLEVPDGWGKTYFGNLRGVDKWKDLDAVAVLGCWTPRPDVVEDQAAVLTMLTGGSVAPAEWSERELRGIRMADGTGVGVLVRSHPDPMVVAVMEQAREAETEQAIARVRPVRHVGEPKRVLLMSSLTVDVTVDELVELKVLAGEDRLGRLLKAGGGVVALSPRLMVESGVFETEKSAERWLERELYPPNSYYILVEERGVKPGAFRRRGQRGPHPTRFLASPDCPDPRAVLEAREGELTFYEGPEPPPEPTPKPAVRLTLVLHADGSRREPSAAPPHPLGDVLAILPPRHPGGEAAMSCLSPPWK